MKISCKDFSGDFEGFPKLPPFTGVNLDITICLVSRRLYIHSLQKFSSSKDCRTDEKDPRSNHSLVEEIFMQTSQIRPKLPQLTVSQM